MEPPKSELAPIELPAVLVYAAALTCGVLAALALQIHLSRAGYDLVNLWENVFSTKSMQLRAAGPWWAIAGFAFIVSGVTAAALSRLPFPWSRFRLLRWLAGVVVILVLADIGHSATTIAPLGTGAGANLAASLGALALAALMSMFGAYFTARR